MDETEELDLVAELFEGLSNRSKLAILRGVADGKTLKEIAETLGITQQGLEKNIDKMLDAGLLARSHEGDETYQLTPIGEYMVNLIEQEWDTFVAAKRIEKENEEKARERAKSGQQALQEKEDDGFTFQIDNETWERVVQTQKWTLAEDDLRELLDRDDGTT